MESYRWQKSLKSVILEHFTPKKSWKMTFSVDFNEIPTSFITICTIPFKRWSKTVAITCFCVDFWSDLGSPWKIWSEATKMVKFGKKIPIFKKPFLHVLAYLHQNSRKIVLRCRPYHHRPLFRPFWTAFRSFSARF